jgi:flavin-dependent dehydrogenase
VADPTEECDVIVVGGGPAGAAAAWELTRHGVDCLILDRADFPREKLCAGWITPQILRDLEFRPEDYPHRFLTFDTLRISFKGLRFSLPSAQHSIRRFEFDHWLLRRSEAPVRRHTVRQIEAVNGGYLIDGKYRCRYLIGAGGTRCPVFREVFRSNAPRSRDLQVVTQELEFPHDGDAEDCHLWFFHNRLPGYAWYVPKQNGYLNIGVGAVASKLKRKQDDIQRHWQLLVDQLQCEGLLDAAPERPGGYSYFLRPERPTGRKGNAFLIGDAAGLATRDMCEGIGPAVRSGLLAARAIAFGKSFDLGTIDPHTLVQPIARRLLDRAFTGAWH